MVEGVHGWLSLTRNRMTGSMNDVAEAMNDRRTHGLVVLQTWRLLESLKGGSRRCTMSRNCGGLKPRVSKRTVAEDDFGWLPEGLRVGFTPTGNSLVQWCGIRGNENRTKSWSRQTESQPFGAQLWIG